MSTGDFCPRFLPVSGPFGRAWPRTAPFKQGVRGPGRAVPLGASRRTVAQAGKRRRAGAPDPCIWPGGRSSQSVSTFS
jgi:hypothetical protein